MKKLLLVLSLILVIGLSGCERKENELTFESEGSTYSCWNDSNGFALRTYHCMINGKELKLTHLEYIKVRAKFDIDEFANDTKEDAGTLNTRYYTQEEVDLMIQEIEDSFDAKAMNNLNERMYELESMLRGFDRFDYEDYYTKEEVDELVMFNTITKYTLLHEYNDTQYLQFDYEVYRGIYTLTNITGCIQICEDWTENDSFTETDFYELWNSKVDFYQEYIE